MIKKGYENFPLWIVLVFNLILLSVYLTGAYLLYLIWHWLALLFLIYIFYNEASIYKEGCVNCYYHGKLCAFGRGKIAGLFLKKGDSKKFCEREVGFKDFIIPSLVNVIPAIAGIYLLIKNFDLFVLALVIWPLVVMFFGNSIIYGEIACPNCKQGKICCPVSKFFMERGKKRK